MRPARHERRGAHGLRAVFLVVLLCTVSYPATATAADPARTPSGEILRNTYPLDTEPPESRSPEPTPAPSRPASQRAQLHPPRKGGFGATALLPLLLTLTLGVAAFWLVRRRRDDGGLLAEETLGPAFRDPRAPSLAIFKTAAAAEPAQDDEGDLAMRPPDPSRKWTAEIAWREADGESRFVVCARPRRGAEAVVLTSDPMKWPPSGADDVASLQRVVSGLEATLLSAGWTALEPGKAWYARRFAWPGVPASARSSSRDPEPARRFSRTSSAAAWRCEIEWRFLTTGWGFRASAVLPPLRGRRVIAESASSFARVDRDSPAARAALDGLVRALAEAGWTLSDSGAPSVWTGEGDPQRLPPTAVAEFTERSQT